MVQDPFKRTRTGLEQDGANAATLRIALGIALLAGWSAWFAGARVSLCQRSEVARVEVDGPIQNVQAPVSGHVVRNAMRLGAEVHAGDVLVELDARRERLALEELQKRRGANRNQLVALRAELEAMESASHDNDGASMAALAQARAQRREADAHARLAREEARRLDDVKEEARVGAMEMIHANVEARTKGALADAARMDLRKLRHALNAKFSDRVAAAARLRRDIAVLEGEERTSEAGCARLEHEIARRTIRSAVDGQVGEVAAIHDGIVREGERLGTIVPRGELHIVAEFAQAGTVGRLRGGQPARVRFPWAQFGALEARVSEVASEPVDGRVRRCSSRCARPEVS